MKYPCPHARFARTLAVGISIALLTGCALPGMHFDAFNTTTDNGDQPANGAPAVKAIIKTITPQLIREEQQIAKTGIQSDLTGIMTPPEPYKIGPGDYLSITVWDHPELVMPVNSMTGTMA